MKAPGTSEGGADAKGGQAERWTIEALPPGLHDAPLDYFFAEHHRQRQAAHMLMLISDGERDEGGVRRLVEFFQSDFAAHIVEEKKHFFPVLQECCLPEDAIDALLGRLALEHDQDATIGDAVLQTLRKIDGGGAASNAELRRVRHFAEHLFRHIALENAVLLPLARARMTKSQEQALAARLGQGREEQDRNDRNPA